MLFPTATFAIFFTVTYGVHLLTRHHQRVWLAMMLAASGVFYAWWNPAALVIVGVTALANHYGALFITRLDGNARRWALRVGVAANLGVLGYFKYAEFFVTSFVAGAERGGIALPIAAVQVALPIGLSFMTFHTISYLVDTERGEVEPSTDVLETALYLLFFPKIIAGPIMRVDDFFHQVRHDDAHPPLVPAVAFGLIAGGLFKKMILSDTLAGGLISPVAAAPGDYGGGDVALMLVALPLRIYCDFSAYSDIATGVAMLFGIQLPKNFRRPFSATTMFEFWGRWHVTLYKWLRDYVFVTLRGPHSTTYRLLTAAVATHIISGLWHGAAWRFVAWGALQGVVLGTEGALRLRRIHQRRRRALRTPLRHVAGISYTYTVFAVLGVLFAVGSVGDGITVLGGLGRWSPPTLLTPAIAACLVGAACPHLIPTWVGPAAAMRFSALHPVVQGVTLAVGVAAMRAVAAPGVAPFLYFQF